MQDAARIALLLSEYDLGEFLGAAGLPGGSAHVLRITAERGAFVLKPVYRAADIEVQARAAAFLANQGIRQAQIVPTRSGALVTADNFFLQEFLPGQIILRPSPRQTVAAMRQVGAMHTALASLPGGYQSEASSIWSRVADIDYLLAELPALLRRYDLAGRRELASLHALGQARDGLLALPRQVVHGDVGPDNVLMAGNEAVAVIDFTPFYESALFGACTALYWYHVYGSSAVAVDGLRNSVGALGERRPWTDDEQELWSVGLLREALRRLATPLAMAAESGQLPEATVAPRRRALHAILAAFPG